ncbi:GCN5 family N-acetyltransferase [Candidatus Magnetomorum sp. HK-1]|nr:GCN5 family N-acetyltransferase [Candidatus Magnetomorum sp. HK-1]
MNKINNIIIKEISKDKTVAMNEIHECINIQENVNWHTEIVSSHVLRADTINRVDESLNLGYILLAINNKTDEIAGFARVTSTFERNKNWLHEIAVKQGAQSNNIGLQLMKAVKKKSLELGATHLFFTYDPFEGQNGRLYLTKCGAKAIKVYENLYGETNTAAHSNRKSHRFLVAWDLKNDKSITENIIENQNIPTIEEMPLPDNLKIFKIEIPYRVQILNEINAKKWQEKTFPILINAINILNFCAVYVLTFKHEKRNYIVLEKMQTE